MADVTDQQVESFFQSGGQTAPAPDNAAPTDGGTSATTPAEPSAGASADAAANPSTAQPDPNKATAPAADAPKMVDLRALHEERQRRQETERQMQAILDQNRAMQELMGRVLPQPATAPEVDPNTDPVGYFQKQLEQIAPQVQEFQQFKAQLAQQAQRQQQETQFMQAYQSAARDFSSKQADFPDAYKHLMATRDSELQTMGYADPQQRAAIILSEEQAIAARAFQDGVNPAERLYAVAKQRGFAPASGTAPQGAGRIDAIAKGQAAASSLSNAGAATNTEISTLEQLAKVGDDAAFLAGWDKLIGRMQ